jgi:hypothetical protein
LILKQSPLSKLLLYKSLTSVGALYLVKKAESEPESNLATVTEAFSNGKNGKTNQPGLEIGSQVLKSEI